MTVILPLFVKCCLCSHYCLMGEKYGFRKDGGIFLKTRKRTRGGGYLVNALCCGLGSFSVQSAGVAGTSQLLEPVMDSFFCSILGVILEMPIYLLLGFPIACLGD